MELKDATPEWLDDYFRQYNTPKDVSETLKRFFKGHYRALEGSNQILHYTVYVFDFRMQNLIFLKRMEYDDLKNAREKEVKYNLKHKIEVLDPSDDDIVDNWDLIRLNDRDLYIERKLDDNFHFLPGYGHAKHMAVAIVKLIHQKCFKEFDAKGHKITKARIIRFCLKRYNILSLQLCYRKEIINSVYRTKP